MKLLKGQSETVEDGNIKLEVGVIDTTTQAILRDLSRVTSEEGRIRMIAWMLRTFITKVEIDGKEYKPDDVASKFDINDTDTMTAIMTIGVMAFKAALPSEEVEKK